MTLTKIQYTTLDEAFIYFNEKLFEGKLPDVLITLQRKSRSNGFHHFEKFVERDGKKRITEIALNPDTFSERSDQEILGTLVHELCHHWQYQFGEPARAGYHDREWGAKMKEIGLYPSATGEIGAKETGQRMTHYIIENGKFEIACGAFLAGGKKIILNSVVEPKEEKEKKKTREKFCCPNCLSAIWAKKSIHVICADCNVLYVKEEE